MNGGIAHRQIQTCPRCTQIFMWSPGPGLCPYCDLSQRARTTGPFDNGVPCAADCCPERKTA